jgi:hypothetical protein
LTRRPTPGIRDASMLEQAANALHLDAPSFDAFKHVSFLPSNPQLSLIGVPAA